MGARRLQKELEELSVTLGLGDSIHFVAPQFDQQKDVSLIRADAFILPSFSEGLPMTVLASIRTVYAWVLGQGRNLIVYSRINVR
jgi:glycosyltransferase involved in cell wall biosynthesis